MSNTEYSDHEGHRLRLKVHFLGPYMLKKKIGMSPTKCNPKELNSLEVTAIAGATWRSAHESSTWTRDVPTPIFAMTRICDGLERSRMAYIYLIPHGTDAGSNAMPVSQ